MCKSLYLFESVINLCWFLCTSVILFLNKIDVFKRKYCLSAFIIPEDDNINIAGTWRGVCSGNGNGDECCGIQHTVLAPRPTCVWSVSSRLGLCSGLVGRDGERRTLHLRDGVSHIPATYINTFKMQI
jgi:hypothetical protein